jgi:hypothetical protein
MYDSNFDLIIRILVGPKKFIWSNLLFSMMYEATLWCNENKADTIENKTLA